MNIRAALLILSLSLAGCATAPDVTDIITVGPQSPGTDALPLTPTVTELDPETGQPKRTGFFAGLFKRSSDIPVEQAVLMPDGVPSDPVAAIPAAVQKPGFFARLTGRGAVLPDDVDPSGGPLPFGQIGRACGMRTRNMGDRVETAGGFKLYDSDPGALTPRSFYIRGFDDRCPRKFTASLAMLGDPLLHETLRYSTEDRPYSKLEKTYERIKARVCNVRRKTPCEKQAAQLVRSTVFVSIYEYFGVANPGGTLLLHNGETVATDFDLQ